MLRTAKFRAGEPGGAPQGEAAGRLLLLLDGAWCCKRLGTALFLLHFCKKKDIFC